MPALRADEKCDKIYTIYLQKILELMEDVR